MPTPLASPKGAEQRVSQAFSGIDKFIDIAEQQQHAAVSESPLKKLSAKEVVSITQLMCPTTLQEAFDIIIQPNNSPFNNTVNSSNKLQSGNAPVTSQLHVPPALMQGDHHIIGGQVNQNGPGSPGPQSGVSPRPPSHADLLSGTVISQIFTTPPLTASQSPEMSLQTFTLHETSPPTIASIHGHNMFGNTASNYTFANNTSVANNSSGVRNTTLTRGSTPESIHQREGSFVLHHPPGAIEVEGRLTRVGSLMAVKAPPGATNQEGGEGATMVMPVTFVAGGSGAVQSRSHLSSPVPTHIPLPKGLSNSHSAIDKPRKGSSGCPTPTNQGVIVSAPSSEFVPISNDSNMVEYGGPGHGGNSLDNTSRSNQIKSVSRAGEAKGLQKQIKKKQVKELAEKQLSVMIKRTQEALKALSELEKSEEYQKLLDDSPLRKQITSHHKNVLSMLREYDGVINNVNIKLAEMGLPALVIDDPPETPLGTRSARSHQHHQSDIPSEMSFRGGCSPVPDAPGFSSNTSVPTTALSDKGKAPYPVSSRFQSRDSMSMPSGVGHHPDSPHDPSLTDHFGGHARNTPPLIHKPSPYSTRRPSTTPTPPVEGEKTHSQPYIGIPHSRRASLADSASSEEILIGDEEAEVMAGERRKKALETRDVIAKMSAQLPEVQSDATFVRENQYRIVPHTDFLPPGAEPTLPSQSALQSEDGSSSSPLSTGTADHTINHLPPFSANNYTSAAAQILSSRGNSVNDVGNAILASPYSTSSNLGPLAGSNPAHKSAAVRITLKVGQILSIAKMVVPSQGRYADCRIISNGHGPDGTSLVLVPLRKIDSGDLLYGSEARAAGSNCIATGEGRVMNGNEARMVTWYYEAAEEGESTIFCKETLVQQQRDIGRSRSSSAAHLPGATGRCVSPSADGPMTSPQECPYGQNTTTVYAVSVAGKLDGFSKLGRVESRDGRVQQS